MKNMLEIKRVDILNFDPRTNIARCGVKYTRNTALKSLVIDFKMDNASAIAQNLISTIKEQEKENDASEEIVDDIKINVLTEFVNEEGIEDMVFNFFARLCDKTRRLKHEKNHVEYMKMFDQVRMEKLIVKKAEERPGLGR